MLTQRKEVLGFHFAAHNCFANIESGETWKAFVLFRIEIKDVIVMAWRVLPMCFSRREFLMLKSWHSDGLTLIHFGIYTVQCVPGLPPPLVHRLPSLWSKYDCADSSEIYMWELFGNNFSYGFLHQRCPDGGKFGNSLCFCGSHALSDLCGCQAFGSIIHSVKMGSAVESNRTDQN